MQAWKWKPTPFRTGSGMGHCTWVAPTNTGKTTGKLNMLTKEEFDVIQNVERAIWVSNENDPRLGVHSKMRVITDMPDYEKKYSLHCLKPDLFTDEEMEEFAEWWDSKRAAMEDDMMAWKLMKILGLFETATRPVRPDHSSLCWRIFQPT
jgi:hypothetical protein